MSKAQRTLMKNFSDLGISYEDYSEDELKAMENAMKDYSKREIKALKRKLQEMTYEEIVEFIQS